MLSSKFFSVLVFAAAAVAQGFPNGEFFISNVDSQLVFEVEEGSSNPGALISLSDRQAGNDGQVWSYTQGRGFLTNKLTNLVIEVPRTDGEVKYGTNLRQAEARDENNDDLVQLWDYDIPSQHLYTLASESACVSGNSSLEHAIVDYCHSGSSEATYQWEFIAVK